MSKEPAKPADSLVQELLAERRQLKVALERFNDQISRLKSQRQHLDRARQFLDVATAALERKEK